MKLAWPRWKLKHLAIAIAVLAVAFSVLGVEATVVVSLFWLPAILAPQGRRLAALYWVVVCYPLLLLCSLYVTWFAAWGALGHPPRPSLDAPRDIGRIAIPYHVTAILMFGTPFALLSAFGATCVRVILRSTPWSGGGYLVVLLAIAPFSWVAGYFLITWDPLGVLYWYPDFD
jgi:hypothetical protein